MSAGYCRIQLPVSLSCMKLCKFLEFHKPQFSDLQNRVSICSCIVQLCEKNEWTHKKFTKCLGWCIRVLQRNRRKRTDGWMVRQIDINSGELGHMFKEAEESQDLQSASWRPRRATGLIPVWVWRPENHETGDTVPVWMLKGLILKNCWPCSLSLKAGKKLMSQLKTNWKPYLQDSKPFMCVCSGLQLTRWGPSMLGKIIFTQSISANVLIQNTLTDTLKIMFDKISGYPMDQSNWHIKFTVMNNA